MRFAIHLSFALSLVFSVTLAQTNFNRINCGGNISLNIKQGDSCSYSSNSDTKSDNSNKLIFEVYNNTLHISGAGGSNSVANVEVKELKGLNVSGSARVNTLNTLVCEDLKAEFSGAAKGKLKIDAVKLYLETSGAAFVQVEGNCQQGSFQSDGASKVDAKKCVFNSCDVGTNGASAFYIDSVTSDLKVDAKGASKIYVARIPEVYVSSRNGSGKIVEGNPIHDSTVRVETKIVINNEDYDEVDTSTGFRKHPHHQIKNAGFNWSGLDLGFNGLLNSAGNLKAPAGYDYLEMNNASSLQVGLNLFEKSVNIHERYVMGMIGCGFSWNHYKFTSPAVLQPYMPTLTAIKDSGKVLNINKLRVSYFNVPLLIGFNTSQNEKKSFHIAVGVVTGLRMGAMVKTTTDSKDGKNKEKTFALYNTDQMRYDFMVRIKYKWANIWATYSLNGLFKKNQGPEVHPVAVGVNVLEF